MTEHPESRPAAEAHNVDPSRFAGRVALVAGAGGGIGRACAQRLAAEGAQVVCSDLDGAAAAATATLINTAGGDAFGHHVDITDLLSCQTIMAATLDRYRQLDVLVNAAGVGRFVATEDLSLDDWNRVLQVNLTGVFLMSQQALPLLLEAQGTIVNIASIAGVRAVPYNAAYCASKAGVVMLTKAMAVEYGNAGLRVNCICPSSVDTAFLEGFAFPENADMSLFARGASIIKDKISPAKIAAAVSYLASDDASSITGTAMLMDGGATA
jgi:NAD(P)-dependent dehydrogenase (short-subunit alcohol dehydrogenase family)